MSVASSAQLPTGPSAQPVPTLAEPFVPKPSSMNEKMSRNTTSGPHGHTEDNHESGKKNKMKGLFGFGKKKTDEPTKAPSRSDPSARPRDIPAQRTPASPIQTDSSLSYKPHSPGRGLSTSPRLSSPAGSQIFERDVQEAALIPNSPAIPSHIITENHVPPVLDASSEAITDEQLNPDAVEIITHTSHQPAAVAVNVTGIPDSMSSSWQDDLAASFAAAETRAQEQADSASGYGAIDSTDIRRLSFISFADVVQAEHQGYAGIAGSRDSIHLAGLTSLSSMGPGTGGLNRSPSPIRSPVSSSAGGDRGTSPPNSKSGSVKGVEMSPSRKSLGSPVSTSLSMSPIITSSVPPPVVSGELNIETMSQALRRTGSGDLSSGGGVRSGPVSPVDGAPSR